MRLLTPTRQTLLGRAILAAAGMWVFLPAAVLFGWPVLLWWMARILSRLAQPWFAAALAVVFGLQVGVLAQRPLGTDVWLLGGTVAFLELWLPLAKGWRRWLGDIAFGGIFCAAFLLAGNIFSWSIWWGQVAALAVVNAVEAGSVIWWRRNK